MKTRTSWPTTGTDWKLDFLSGVLAWQQHGVPHDVPFLNILIARLTDAGFLELAPVGSVGVAHRQPSSGDAA